MFHLVFVIIGGFLAGVIASHLVGGETPQGFWPRAFLGIAGGIIGRMLMPLVGLAGQSYNPLWNLAVAIIGAGVVLALAHAFAPRLATRNGNGTG